MPLHDRQVDHLAERYLGQLGNQLLHQIRLRGGFDHKRELHGRFGQAHGLLRRGELGAIDDVSPLDEVRNRPRVKSEFFGSDGSEKLGAGLVGRIVKLLARVVVPEMLGVLRLQERALMVVEPPGQQRGAGILEIDDGVFVTVESAVLKRLRGLVGHAGIEEFRVGIDALPVEAGKDRRRRRPVEAFIVKADSNRHSLPPLALGHSRRCTINESQSG